MEGEYELEIEVTDPIGGDKEEEVLLEIKVLNDTVI